MNIFVLDQSPEMAAQFHCDKHVVKMVLETAQILSTVNHYCGLAAPYRPTHQRHPCVVWAAESSANYAWLVRLGLALSDEYTYRYRGRTHKSSLVIRALSETPLPILDTGATPFVQAMPEQYRHPDAVIAYRQYYVGDKRDLLTYTRRPAPDFVANLEVTA